MTQLIAIIGYSGSGKTTLIEKLIPELKRRGLRIGTIKHTHHDVDMDDSGKDTARHRKAGADTVVLAGNGQMTMVKGYEETGNTPDITEMSRFFTNVDLIIAEGYKHSTLPKIEIHRKKTGHFPISRSSSNGLVAYVTDGKPHPGVPTFGLDDIEALADFVEAIFLRPAAAAGK